jgi:hypothetical protein
MPSIGDPSSLPGRRSFTSLVPVVLPLLTQSSVPLMPSAAKKKKLSPKSGQFLEIGINFNTIWLAHICVGMTFPVGYSIFSTSFPG